MTDRDFSFWSVLLFRLLAILHIGSRGLRHGAFQEDSAKQKIIPGKPLALKLGSNGAGLHSKFIISWSQQVARDGEFGRHPRIDPILHRKIPQEAAVDEHSIGWFVALQDHVQFPGTWLGVLDVKPGFPGHTGILGPIQGSERGSFAVPEMDLFILGQDEDT